MRITILSDNMPPIRKRPVRQTRQKAKQKANPHMMTAGEFEKFIKTNPVEAERFCNQRASDFGRQGDAEMSEFWKERANKIRNQNRR